MYEYQNYLVYLYETIIHFNMQYSLLKKGRQRNFHKINLIILHYIKLIIKI